MPTNTTPIYDPTARWTIWSLDEIYTGPTAQKKYVPKVNDYVIKTDDYTTYIVDAVDLTTLLSTLRVIKPNGAFFEMSTEDVLFGVGPGTQADTYRAYFDKTVTPHVLCVDQRLKVAGTMARYAKIFRGADTSSNGKVIGMLFDQGGTFLTYNIPLELAAIETHTNHAIRNVQVCYTTEKMINGEIITVVIYNDAGHVVSKRQLLVEETSFIRSVSSSGKYISHISLETPFLSQTQDGLIEFPINVPVQALNLMGRVHYSDGTIATMPVDGTKFKVYGLDQYVATVVGHKIEIVLAYTLSSNETAIGSGVGDGKFITEPYEIITTKVEGAYSVKLFGYPYWVSPEQGYRIEWFLYNLDRNIIFNVTNHVLFNPNTGPFDPKAYGFLQRLSVRINLADVSGTFKSYIHTQAIDIFLRMAPNSSNNTLWEVGLDAGVSNTLYGNNLFATYQATSIGPQPTIKVRIDANIATKELWLDNVYKKTFPLFNPKLEISAPLPNYFAISFMGVRSEYSLDKWNQDLFINNPLITAHKTLHVEFFRRTTAGDVQLSVAGLSLRQVT
jgi:hypothetical protein